MLKYIATRFRVYLNESKLAYMGPDCLGGPQVCITFASGRKLIFLRGGNIFKFSKKLISEYPKDASLIYSEKEWLAFLNGAKHDEFDSIVNGDATDSYLIRDSKDPEGPVLVFNKLQMTRFIRAVKKGKYDI